MPPAFLGSVPDARATRGTGRVELRVELIGGAKGREEDGEFI